MNQKEKHKRKIFDLSKYFYRTSTGIRKLLSYHVDSNFICIFFLLPVLISNPIEFGKPFWTKTDLGSCNYQTMASEDFNLEKLEKLFAKCKDGDLILMDAYVDAYEELSK